MRFALAMKHQVQVCTASMEKLVICVNYCVIPEWCEKRCLLPQKEAAEYFVESMSK